MSISNLRTIKIILLGDSGVGKSSIIQRYYKDKFDANLLLSHSGSFIEKEITINEHTVKLEVWDTVGQEEYRSLTKIFVKNSKIAILVYNVTSKSSFESLDYWYDFTKTNADNNIVYGLAGNKTDLILEPGNKEEVNPQEAKEFAKKINGTFALVSAKESLIEIELLFNELVSRYLENRKDTIDIGSTICLSETKNFLNNKSECCFGKNDDNELKMRIAFLGSNGVGKTAIIKTIKGKTININDLTHTKKCYKENIYYNRKGRYIKVVINDTNGTDCQDDIFKKNVSNCSVFFLVFNIYKKNTLYELENWINSINKNSKVYLLGYSNENTIDKDNDFDYEDEAQYFAKKYGLEYESVSLDDIYKVKALILDNIKIYMKSRGY